MIALSRSDDGWYIVPVPDRLPSDSVTVLQYAGVGLFAEVPRIDEDWPQVATAKVFERGGLVDILGPGGVIPLSDRVFGAIEQSVESGERWIAERREEPPVTG